MMGLDGEGGEGRGFFGGAPGFLKVWALRKISFLGGCTRFEKESQLSSDATGDMVW